MATCADVAWFRNSMPLLCLSVPLSDPSCYAPVMDYLKNMAEDVEQDGNDYCVLLLLTDGGIAGMRSIVSFKRSMRSFMRSMRSLHL